jgi:hypothetical protein
MDNFLTDKDALEIEMFFNSNDRFVDCPFFGFEEFFPLIKIYTEYSGVRVHSDETDFGIFKLIMDYCLIKLDEYKKNVN